VNSGSSGALVRTAVLALFSLRNIVRICVARGTVVGGTEDEEEEEDEDEEEEEEEEEELEGDSSVRDSSDVANSAMRCVSSISRRCTPAT